MTETTSYPVNIYMAGDIAQAKQVIREYCWETGFCVHVCPADYIYTGGEEAGFVVGLINYPRFPSAPATIWRRAEELASRLQSKLCQKSATIQAPDKTVWLTFPIPAEAA